MLQMPQQNKLQISYRVLAFERGGRPNQRLVKHLRRVAKSDEEVVMLIDAVMVWGKEQRAVTSKRGPMGMHASRRQLPQPYAKVGGVHVMLPRLVYRPFQWAMKRMGK